MKSDLSARPSEALPRLPWDLERGEEAERPGGTIVCVKRTRSRRVLHLPGEALLGEEGAGELAGAGLFAKRYANKTLWRRVAWRLGRSKAAIEARLAARVAARGFLVAKVLAWAVDANASYLLTLELPGLRAFDDELAALPEEERAELWRRGGEFMRAVWRAGIRHPDFLAEHLCRCDGADGRAFALIDLDGVRLGRPGHLPSISWRAYNAMQLLRSTAPHLGDAAARRRFLAAAFAEEWPDRSSEILAAVERAAEKERTEVHLA